MGRAFRVHFRVVVTSGGNRSTMATAANVGRNKEKNSFYPEQIYLQLYCGRAMVGITRACTRQKIGPVLSVAGSGKLAEADFATCWSVCPGLQMC